jgi:hypothetical protein
MRRGYFIERGPLGGNWGTGVWIQYYDNRRGTLETVIDCRPSKLQLLMADFVYKDEFVLLTASKDGEMRDTYRRLAGVEFSKNETGAWDCHFSIGKEV